MTAKVMKIRQIDASEYLFHHGIKGQKWGVRNGPPYPLTAQAKASAYSKNNKGSGRYGDSEGKDYVKSSRNIAIATTAFVAYITAMYALGAASRNKYRKKWGPHREDNAKKLEKDRENEQIDPKTGLYLKKEDLGIDDDLKKINPSYKDGQPFQTNCTMCTAAMEMRRRGYDVAACGLVDTPDGGLSRDTFSKWFKPPTEHKDYNLDADTYVDERSKMKKEVAAQGDGARGEILVEWELDGGHSMFYQVEKGEMVVYDGQNGKKYEGKKLDKLLDMCETAEIRRLDNLKPDMNAINSEECRPLC